MFPTPNNKQIDPGAMRELVRIQTRTTGISSIGEPITTEWTDIADPLRWAGVVQNSSSEIVQAEGIVSSFGATFYLRYPLANVEPGNSRIIYRENIYHVAGIDRNTFRNHLVIVSCLRLDDTPIQTIAAVQDEPGTVIVTQVGEGNPIIGPLA